MGTVACEQLYSMVPKFEEIRKFGMKEAEVDGISPTKCRHGSTSVKTSCFTVVMIVSVCSADQKDSVCGNEGLTGQPKHQHSPSVSAGPSFDQPARTAQNIKHVRLCRSWQAWASKLTGKGSIVAHCVQWPTLYMHAIA